MTMTEQNPAINNFLKRVRLLKQRASDIKQEITGEEMGISVAENLGEWANQSVANDKDFKAFFYFGHPVHVVANRIFSETVGIDVVNPSQLQEQQVALLKTNLPGVELHRVIDPVGESVSYSI